MSHIMQDSILELALAPVPLSAAARLWAYSFPLAEAW